MLRTLQAFRKIVFCNRNAFHPRAGGNFCSGVDSVHTTFNFPF